MVKSNKRIGLVDEAIINKIFVIRGQKVMIDRDLAELYGVETKVLKQAVRRNARRFPRDFMFEMNKNEFKNWRSQFVTSKGKDNKGLRYAPFCFTEHGVTMLSSILNTPRAVAVNIQIIRIFIRMRQLLITHKDLLLKIQQLESRTGLHDIDIEKIFSVLKSLLNPPTKPLPPIGFKLKGK